MEPRPAAAPAPASAGWGAGGAGVTGAATPGSLRASSAPRRPHPRGRPFPAERRFGDPRPLKSRPCAPSPPHHVPPHTRGCVTGRHVRDRRGASPARPRAQAQSAALRPAGRMTPSPPPPPPPSPPRPASRLLEGRPGRSCRCLTRPGPAGIRPVASGTGGGGGGEEGLVRRPRQRCPPNFHTAKSFPPAPQQHPQSLSELRPERAQSLLLPATCGP